MITVFCHDGTKKQLDLVPTLDIIQCLVGGLIQMVPGTNNVWCNEEGLIHQLPINVPASKKYNQTLVGQVVVADLD